MASAVEAEQPPHLEGLGSRLRTVPASLGELRKSGAISAREDAALLHASSVLEQLVREAEDLAEVARTLDAPERAAAPKRDPRTLLTLPTPPWRLLRENLTLDSAIARYALRMAITTAVAVWVAKRLHLGHGYWTTITCLVILQPQGSATFAKALQRVAGTALGAAIAKLVASMRDEIGPREPHRRR